MADGTPPGGNAGEQDAGQQGAGNQDAVQKAIDAVVARERTRAERREADLRAEFEAKLAEATKKPTRKTADDGDEDERFKAKVAEARKPVEDELNQVRDLLAKRDAKVVRGELRRYADAESIDGDIVTDALAAYVRVGADGEPEVVDAEKKPRYGKSGPMTVAELVGEFLAKKPHLARAKGKPGAGFEGKKAAPPAASGSSDLDAQIAEAEAAGKWGEASILKFRKQYAEAQSPK